jgi:type I restriction enzyme, S subunit
MTSIRFADVVTLSTTRTADPLAAGIERFVGLEHIEPENLHIRSWGNVADGTTFTSTFKSGQVLFGKRRAYQRKVAVTDFDGVCSSDIYIFESKDSSVLLPKLLPFICQSEGFYQYAIKTSAGSLSPRTNWTHLANYEFPLPPVDEQRRIADLLWAADDVITEWQSTIGKLEILLASVREDVLCNKALPRKKLSTCIKSITAGKSVLGLGKPATANEYGVLKVSAVGVEGFVAEENKVLEDPGTFISAFSVHMNDLLITRANTRELVGRVCKAPNEYSNLMLSDKTLRLEVDEALGDKDFLLQILKSRESRSQIEAMASGTGGAMKNISQVQIMNLNLPLPELSIQKELTSRSNEIERVLEQTRCHLVESFELKKQLLNKMF